MLGWDDWNINLHRQEEQTQRIDSSFEVKFTNIDTANGMGVTAAGYDVSLDRCTCPDFTYRKLPCKHIYALAKELNKFIVPQKIERSNDLIVELGDNGLSKDWMFTVGKHNYLSLDIRWNETSKRYTQGKDFHFTTGAVYYDSPLVYENKSWQKVVKEIEFSLQVNSSTTNIRHYNLEQKDKILYAKPIFDYGITTFSVYRVNRNFNREEFFKKFICPNDEFVKLLKSGCCKSIGGEVISVEDWYN